MEGIFMYCNIYLHFCLNTIETLIYGEFEMPSVDIQLHHPFMSCIMFQHSEKGLWKAGCKFTEGLSWLRNYLYGTDIIRKAGLQPKYSQDEYLFNTAFLPISLFVPTRTPAERGELNCSQTYLIIWILACRGRCCGSGGTVKALLIETWLVSTQYTSATRPTPNWPLNKGVGLSRWHPVRSDRSDL